MDTVVVAIMRSFRNNAESAIRDMINIYKKPDVSRYSSSGKLQYY